MTLDDKYSLEAGSVYLTGIQALVRLPIDQMRRDRRAGLRTGAFISGYEGSPLGGYDLALARVPQLLRDYHIHFVPGVNEDLAATSVFGSQIVHVLGESKYDGVVGIWYGKGPGVDRSGDILRHANIAGTGRNCAALVLAGDDHLSKSSTIPHQSDFSLYNFALPTLYPGNTQEILDYGLMAIALSRFSGAWAAMKMVTNVCDGGGTVLVDPERLAVRLPGGYEKKSDPRLIVPFTLILEYEVNQRRLDIAREFARLNGINTVSGAGEGAWLGIATAGKPYYDLRQALHDAGVRPEEHGIRIAKYGMTFPVEPRFTAEFARGLRKILVIEEKRSFLELQLREVLYNHPDRPVIVGKQDESGAPLLASTGELDPEDILKALAGQVPGVPALPDRLRLIAEIQSRQREPAPPRHPTFCSGCPHNRSTVLLPGQAAGGGIGCHAMAATLSHTGRGYAFLTHMGGEGAPWIGMSPFVERRHMFQNIGDGTYFHSGAMAITAAVAAGVNITYKILYNSAVAMTGGQPVSGALPIPELTRKLEAEGVVKTVVLTDDLEKYRTASPLASNATLRDRDDLAETMRELEQIPGVTAIVYDQQCAAEKRRLRSRGKIEEPSLRLVIHEEVCEGCGDCVRQSNCMSLYPVQTEYGPKTRIHQSSCNKDYSCLLGDCPSFVTVRLKPGTGLKKRPVPQLPSTEVPAPREKVPIGDAYAILSPGIGGTGVVTINALLATAAWIDGVSAVTLDQTGLAQKGGAVVSSVIFSERPIELSNKIGYGNADLILGFDVLGAGGADNLKRAHPSRTVAVVNTADVPTGDAVRGKQLAGPGRLIDLINQYTQPGRNLFVDASRIAEGLFASHLAVNVFLVGVAYQAGLIPLSAGALEEAIRLNRVEADRNLQAFLWGRKYYYDARSVEELVAPPTPKIPEAPLVERRVKDLTAYQSAAYAAEFEQFVRKVADRAPQLEEPVARSLYKLMAYKDEYEVARLLTKPSFREQLGGMWEQVESIGYNLHPPLLRALGFTKKMRLGEWFSTPLRLLAKLKFLRGTPLDPFGYARARREERRLIGWYRELIEQILDRLTPGNLQLAQEIAALPDQIRGYEQIKSASVETVQALAAQKLEEMAPRPVVQLG